VLFVTIFARYEKRTTLHLREQSSQFFSERSFIGGTVADGATLGECISRCIGEKIANLPNETLLLPAQKY
jgi:hypothetical protein